MSSLLEAQEKKKKEGEHLSMMATGFRNALILIYLPCMIQRLHLIAHPHHFQRHGATFLKGADGRTQYCSKTKF